MAYFFFRTTAMFFHLAFFVCIFLVCKTIAELPRFEHRTKGDGSFSFLVVGDWGREGFYNQSEVALQMGKIGENLDIDFVISTGDNFYENGLVSVNDPAFVKSFTKIYTAKSLQKQWYAVLGNHDYRGNVQAELSPILRVVDNRWLCLRSFIVNAEMADFYFIDTTPFVDNYFTDKDHTYDWRGVFPRNTYIINLLKDLESALKYSTAKWKIVVGHHAIKSVGYHGETQELIQHLLPLLEANNVDFYINGHDHCLEHMSSQPDSPTPIQFLTSGGGSKAWREDHNIGNYNRGNDAVKFFYDGQGFMSLQITHKHAHIAFYNAFGQVLHRWNISKHILRSQI